MKHRNGNDQTHSLKITPAQWQWAEAEGARIGLGAGNVLREAINQAMRNNVVQPPWDAPKPKDAPAKFKPTNKPAKSFRDLPIAEQAQAICNSEWYEECEGMEDPEGVKDFLEFVSNCEDIHELSTGQQRLWLKIKSFYRQYS